MDTDLQHPNLWETSQLHAFYGILTGYDEGRAYIYQILLAKDVMVGEGMQGYLRSQDLQRALETLRTGNAGNRMDVAIAQRLQRQFLGGIMQGH